MSKKTIKKLQKSKKDIVSDIQLSQDATRRRALIKDVVFPYLMEMNDTIAYSKVFLQAYSGLIEGVYEENRKTTTVGQIKERIENKIGRVFTISNPEQKKEYDRYISFTEKLSDVSIQDLSYAMQLPQYIDGFLMADKGKEPIKNIPLDKLLG